jgi:hypothetical protein
MSAVQAQADVAKTAVQVYAGQTDAYAASLTGYKAQFEAYSTRVRGVSAQNQIEQAKTQISVADIQAAGASVQNLVAGLEVRAEQLKLQARKIAAQNEDKRLVNAVETVKAQIDADKAKVAVAEWQANAQLGTAVNEAITDNAQSAVRYYENASNSAYRAAEAAFRAVTSATQAAAIAQEAAGKTGASVAQGAYSAVHISASLQGAGRISAAEDRSDRVQHYFSDMLNYSDERVQVLSA